VGVGSVVPLHANADPLAQLPLRSCQQ
jgi:hypothetical protein